MSREIKFRAWDKEHEIMTDSPVNKINFAGQIHLHSGWADVEDTCYELMQYTGLKDKNGREIYEGDILKITYGDFTAIEDESPWVVGDGNDGFCFHSDICYLRNVITYSDETAVKIIGNIYENPELLETEVKS